jgi:serine/threonine protein phosphatase PrpC
MKPSHLIILLSFIYSLSLTCQSGGFEHWQNLDNPTQTLTKKFISLLSSKFITALTPWKKDEDRCIVSEKENGNFYGVFDGHGGEEVVEILTGSSKDEVFFDPLAKNITIKPNEPDESIKNINACFIEANEEIKKQLDSTNISGSTASILWEPKTKGAPYVMCVGDSPVYIITENKGEYQCRMTQLQNTDNQSEVKRLEDLGTHVEEHPFDGLLRVKKTGSLVTRDFGWPSKHKGIEPCPFIYQVPLNTKAIIISSDGVPDAFEFIQEKDRYQNNNAMQSAYVSHLLNTLTQENKPITTNTLKDYFKKLEEELRGKLRADDMSMIIVRLENSELTGS